MGPITWEATYIYGTQMQELFVWVLLHNRGLTSDSPTVHGWPHDGVRSLCNMEQEIDPHLARDCLFLWIVWGMVSYWTAIDNDQYRLPSWQGTQERLWRNYHLCPRNIWFERNGRIFRQESIEVPGVAYRTFEDILQRRQPFRGVM